MTTPTDYDTLITALRYLANIAPDGWSQGDSLFSKRDARFGSSLARQSVTRLLSDKQQIAAFQLLQAYRSNLQKAGITLPVSYTPPPLPRPPVFVRVDDNQVTIDFDYHPDMVQAVKKIPDSRFDSTAKVWHVPLPQLLEVLTVFPDAETNEATRQAVAKLRFDLERRRHIAALATQTASDFVVPGLAGELMPFQRAGVQYLDLTDGRALLADEMGLGKTVQSLAYLALYPDLRPALIITPASLKLNWQREAAKWLSAAERITVLAGATPDPTTFADASLIIVNYDVLNAWWQTLQTVAAPVVILDEAHYIKNRRAKRARAAYALVRSAPHLIMLTGTPILNRPVELWPLLHLLAPAAWPSLKSFQRRYCGAVLKNIGRDIVVRRSGFDGLPGPNDNDTAGDMFVTNQVWDYTGASNLDELNERIKPYVIRRLKEQVLTDLPPKRHVVVPIELPPKERRHYNVTLEKTAEMIRAKREAGQSLGAAVLTQIEKLKQAAAKGKLKTAIDWITDRLNESKLVVFTTHTFMVDQLMSAFGDRAVRLTGAEDAAARQVAIDHFQNDNATRLFVGNIKAAGVGLTLTAASNVAFLELDWTPANHDQAEDRLHRIGQQSSVTVWYLLASNTIDEDIVELLDRKRQVIAGAIDGDFDMVDELGERIAGMSAAQ